MPRRFGKRRGYKRNRKGKKVPASKAIRTMFRKGKSYKIKPDPFPPRLVTRCKYATTGQLMAAASANAFGLEHVYRLTTIYDPYYSTGGTTTVGWDIFSSIYKSYIVYGARIEVTFYDPNNHDGGVCAVSLNQYNPLQANTLKTVGEQMLTYTNQINNTGSQKKTFNFYVKPWALLGLSKLEWLANKSTHSSLMSTHPTADVYLRLAYATNNGTSVNAINYTLRIIYLTEMYDRVQLSSTTVVT